MAKTKIPNFWMNYESLVNIPITTQKIVAMIKIVNEKTKSPLKIDFFASDLTSSGF